MGRDTENSTGLGWGQLSVLLFRRISPVMVLKIFAVSRLPTRTDEKRLHKVDAASWLDILHTQLQRESSESNMMEILKYNVVDENIYLQTILDLGYVFEPGSKIPCQGQQLFFWVQAPQIPSQRPQWAQPPQFVSVGGI